MACTCRGDPHGSTRRAIALAENSARLVEPYSTLPLVLLKARDQPRLWTCTHRQCPSVIAGVNAIRLSPSTCQAKLFCTCARNAGCLHS